MNQFTTLQFFQELGANPQIDAPGFPFAGLQSSTQSFTISGAPQAQAYLVFQLFGVNTFQHQVLVNGKPIQGTVIPSLSGGWVSWVDVFPASALQQGANTLQIVSNDGGANNFLIGNVIVNWQQPAAPAPPL